MKISPPLGKTARTIRLPGGAQVETTDLKAVAALEGRLGKNIVMRHVSLLESSWKVVVASVTGIVICVWAFIAYGIPPLAKMVAASVPKEVAGAMSRQTLEFLDGKMLAPSELKADRVAEIRACFEELVAEVGPSKFDYKVDFRKSPFLGPNAFALPSGQIVLTDELVELSEGIDEIRGVLAHEVAHVVMRHGLRAVIQDAGVFALVTLVVGDATSITSLASSLPTVLTQSGYSRKFEREADIFAATQLIKKGRGTQPYRDILERLTKNAPRFYGEKFISTHPATEERIKLIDDIERKSGGKKQVPLSP